MIAEAGHYPLWRQLALGCADRPAPTIAYKIWGLGHIFMAYPLIVAPAFYNIWLQDEVVVGHSEFTDVIKTIWGALHILLLLSVASLVWGTRSSQIGAWRSRLPVAMAVAIACDLVTTLLYATLHGFITASPHLILFMVITIARIFYPFRVAAVGLISVSVAIAILAVIFWFRPELAGVIPALGVHEGDPRNLIVLNGLLLIVLNISLFCGVNFIVNQRNILHSYLTEQVLNRYLPQKLVDQAEIGELSFDHEPERKVLTIMFADLVGFTALSEKLGSDGVGKIINRYLGELSEIAHYHGGTIDKFVGDCIMVFFGAPNSMTPEAQAYRCVEMARQIHERIDEIDWGHPLKVRVGIATGEVVVGHFGSKMRSDYTVIGPSVNLAARLESQCRPGAILLSKATAELIGESLTLNEVGPLSLKGVGDGIYAFEFEP